MNAIRVMPDGPNGDVYVGGAFDHVVTATSTRTPASNIADWEIAPGGVGAPQWVALGFGVDSTVDSLAETTQTSAGAATTHVLYVGGRFTHAGGGSAVGTATYTVNARLGSSRERDQRGRPVSPHSRKARPPGSSPAAGGQFLSAGAKPSDGLALWTATSGLKP